MAMLTNTKFVERRYHFTSVMMKMIGWRVGNVVKGFARNGDDVLGNCKVVHALDREWKLLLRPAEHHLSNLTPFWANGNFGADRSDVVSAGIYKRDVNV